MTDNNYAIRLTWADGTTATPLRNLSEAEANECVVDLQPTIKATMSVVKLTAEVE
jgi:hypothetical protein